MSVEHLTVSLRGHHPDGRSVTAEEFTLPLEITSTDAVAETLVDRGKWQSALIIFSSLHIEDYASLPEPHEAFASALESGFESVAAWLTKRPPETFQAIRKSGIELTLFINMWIDQDQMELKFPPSFLRACGVSGIPIEVISND